MRKVFLQNFISLDGYFAGPDGGLDWHNVDEEFNEYAIANLDTIDTLLFGRVTYEGMASYWPTPEGVRDDPVVARKMNHLTKIVFSKTLKSASWENSFVVSGNPVAEVMRLKLLPGKDIAIFGSSDLATTLIPANLIDEYHIFVNPVFLGGGKPLFQGIRSRLHLHLVRTRIFRNGNVLLVYQKIGDQG